MPDVDILIDETYSPTTYTWAQFLTQYGLTADSSLKFMKAKQVWRFDGLQNAQWALDWFSGAVAEPDAVLKDLVGAVHPGSAAQQGIWLRQLSAMQPTVVTATQCASANQLAAAPLLGTDCTVPTCVASGVNTTNVDLFAYKTTVSPTTQFTVTYHGTYKLTRDPSASHQGLPRCSGSPQAGWQILH